MQVSGKEKILEILPIKSFIKEHYVMMVTKKGIIKKTSLEQFSKPRPSGIIALTTDLDDQVIAAKLTTGNDDIYIATKNGMSIRFSESDVRPMGRTARGVKAITLGDGDEVMGAEVFSKDSKSTVLMVTEGGYGKRTSVEEYRIQSRGGVGIITQKTTDKVGPLVGVRTVKDTDDLVIITTGGQVIRMSCAEISTIGRNTQGVRLINLSEGESVTGIAVISDEESDQELVH